MLSSGRIISFDAGSERALQEIADEFIESVTTFSTEIAKHRNGENLSAKDIRLHLQQNWGLDLDIPGEPEVKKVKVESEEPAVQVKTEESASSATGAAAIGVTAVVEPPKAMTLHEQRLKLKAIANYAMKH